MSKTGWTGGESTGWLADREVRVVALLLVFWFAWSDRAAWADLTHRYTFNDGTAADSIGSADGVLFGNATANSVGVLQLPGGAADYVSLNGPAIGLNSYVDATFEAWFTSTQLLTWQRVFDFGDRTVPVSQQGYIYYTPLGGNGGGLGVYATAGQRTEAPHAALATNHLYHLAMVIDDNANGGADLLSIYLDGQLQASVSHNRSLSNVGTAFAYLGKSQIAADPNFNGGLDEFRIHNHAFSLGEVQASFATGPTPQTTLRLEVNTVTGSVAIAAPEFESMPIDYYTITSDDGALDPVNWLSFDDQNLDASGPGAGQSWDEADPSDSSRLTELYLLGSSTVFGGSPLGLGHAFDPTVIGRGVDGDLLFRYARQGSPQLQTGEVDYVTPSQLDGDYNDNQLVDAADYTVWRNSLGSTTNLNADGDHDSIVDQDDYVVWKWSFGNAAGSGAGSSPTAAVPEPTAAVLWLAAVAAHLLAYSHRRRCSVLRRATIRRSGTKVSVALDSVSRATHPRPALARVR